MKAPYKGIERWMHCYGILREGRSDGGTAYGKEFTEFCRKSGVNHCLSSAYNPQFNGSTEKGVGQIKLLQDQLDMLVF